MSSPKQKIFLIAGLINAVMILFPPFKSNIGVVVNKHEVLSASIKYGFILSPPLIENALGISSPGTIHYLLLIIQILVFNFLFLLIYYNYDRLTHFINSSPGKNGMLGAIVIGFVPFLFITIIFNKATIDSLLVLFLLINFPAFVIFIRSYKNRLSLGKGLLTWLGFFFLGFAIFVFSLDPQFKAKGGAIILSFVMIISLFLIWCSFREPKNR